MQHEQDHAAVNSPKKLQDDALNAMKNLSSGFAEHQ
jgi:hypothetical protein